MSSRPPCHVERLRAERLRGRDAEALLGDLLEELDELRVPASSAAAGRRWLWRETLAALVLRPAPGRLLRGLLRGVGPADPLTLGAVAACVAPAPR